MTAPSSRKKSAGRPALDPLEKQRRLVARLYENCDELERVLREEAGLVDAQDEVEKYFLESTLRQRLSLAREAAMWERGEHPVAAKEIRQKLNLFRQLGYTEETWNALPDEKRRLAPGKPKMPKELELARLEIERELEQKRLREMEAEAGEPPADLTQLQVQHGKNATGRAGKDTLGVLDKQMHIAIYKRRDLLLRHTKAIETGEKPKGRPPKALADRYEYFTSITEHCHRQIRDLESKLPLLDLQRRLIKRMRDAATRTRLRIKTSLGAELVTLKLDLQVIESRIEEEVTRLNEFSAKDQFFDDKQRASLRESVIIRIGQFDSKEMYEEFNDRNAFANKMMEFERE
ncbi:MULTISPECIES: hypothetical protein [unclassified Pseudomonas]|uniref:hypothetical protein n=1 Tax=unclassified Pseudomonas TaxID=196821 RepID=UPI001CBE0E98|nr:MULTISPECIES: hypothetical protein [unclassified Pseudomonas]